MVSTNTRDNDAKSVNAVGLPGNTGHDKRLVNMHAVVDTPLPHVKCDQKQHSMLNVPNQHKTKQVAD